MNTYCGINKTEKKLILLSLEIQSEIIKFSYCSYLSGYFAIHKTQNTIRNKFWWPKLLSNVKEYINSCLIYNRVKHPLRKKGYIAINPWSYQPLEVITIDYMLELPKAPAEYNHILVVKGHFSKFIKLYVVKDRMAKIAAKYVTDYFLDYVISLKLLSDQDPSYESELFATS